MNIFRGLLVDRLELQFRLYTRTETVLDEDSMVFPEPLLRQPNFQNWWDANSDIYHPEFRTYFEDLLNKEQE